MMGKKAPGRAMRYDQLVLKPVGNTVVEVDVSLIPEYQRRQLAEFVLDLTRQIFSIPGEEERYQAWLREQESKKEENHA